MQRLMILIFLTLAGCATSRMSGSDNEFQVGSVYKSRTTLFAVTWGNRAELVNSYRPGSGKRQPAKVVSLPPGTRIEVLRVRGDNTLTRGVDEWPQGLILGGPHEGLKVSLDMPGLRSHFDPARQPE